jgi:hypothetical protein
VGRSIQPNDFSHGGEFCMSLLKNRITAVLAGSALVVGVGATGAVAGGMIDSGDIRNGSVRGVDLRDGVNSRIQNKASDGQVAGLEERVSALEEQVAALTAQDASGVNTNWVAKDGATIVDPSTVTVSNVGTTAGSSVEIQNLDLPVQALQTVEFTYELADDAVYGGGSPRVFLEINGTYYNTFDADPSDAGVENSDGSFTKTWEIPVNGRVGAAGVVQDSGAGSVTVSDLVVSGHPISFQ